MLKSKFKNELGNPITIKVKNVKDTNQKLKFDAININIIGLNSTSEWSLTKREGFELHKMLAKFYGKNEKKVLSPGAERNQLWDYQNRMLVMLSLVKK